VGGVSSDPSRSRGPTATHQLASPSDKWKSATNKNYPLLSILPQGKGKEKMKKQVFLITGTPCVGKTTIARQLAAQLDALYVNLTELAKKDNLIQDEDAERKTTIINENRMRHRLKEIIDQTEKTNVVIDGHYAAAVVPKTHVTRIFVLRRNPVELREFMEKCGFSGDKLWENLASEILDVCLVEALREQEAEKTCELDVTHKTVAKVVAEMMQVLGGRKKCRVGCVDWLGMLETQGTLENYLKI
jgi:adenylate kinase